MTVELFNTVSKLPPIRFVFPPPDGPGKNEFFRHTSIRFSIKDQELDLGLIPLLKAAAFLIFSYS